MLDFLKNYDNLTVSEKKVLKYLTENIADIPWLNINGDYQFIPEIRFQRV